MYEIAPTGQPVSVGAAVRRVLGKFPNCCPDVGPQPTAKEVLLNVHRDYQSLYAAYQNLQTAMRKAIGGQRDADKLADEALNLAASSIRFAIEVTAASRKRSVVIEPELVGQ